MRIGDWGSDGCSSDLRSHQSPRDTKELEDHIRALRRYARALIGHRSDADDLVQETLRRALTYLSDGREIRNPRAYLPTMLHHVRVDPVKRSEAPRVGTRWVSSFSSRWAPDHIK